MTPPASGPQQYLVVLADGVQTVTQVVFQILRSAGSTSVEVTPAALARMPVVEKGLDLSAYPDAPLNVVGARENPATCWWWERSAGENLARVRVVSGPTIPVPKDKTDKVVSLVKADDSGGEADRVYFGSGYANFVTTTGNDPEASTTESLWWLSDSGVRFGVEDTRETKSALGLTGEPSRAPWVALRLLAPGPALSRADAMVRHDTLPADDHPAGLGAPK